VSCFVPRKGEIVVRESAIAVNVGGSKRRCVLLWLCRGECEAGPCVVCTVSVNVSVRVFVQVRARVSK
jgi:hypothetical protein